MTDNAGADSVGAKTDNESEAPKRLYRSQTNKVIGGVAGGLGEYLGVDPVLIRIAWILFAILGGAGILAYIVALIVVPEKPASETDPSIPGTVSSEVPEQIGLIIGIALVGAGLWFLFGNLGIIPRQFYLLVEYGRRAFLPSTLIVVGILIILAAGKGKTSIVSSGKTIYRSRTDKKVAGVAGGLAKHLNADPTLVRLVFVLLLFVNFPAALVTYIVSAIVLQEEPAQPSDKGMA